jgi:acyl dehydratase
VVDKAEMIAFAKEYDPQPFHIDEDAAAKSMFGGLIASGWQTASVTFRLAVDGLVGRVASMGSPGVDELRWLKPVRPGDVLTGRSEILETWPSRSKPIGFVRRRIDMVNQHGEVVVRVVGISMYRRRPAAAA